MAVTFSKLGEFGRLGNQLFQIASTCGIAIKNQHSFAFHEWKYQKYFKNKLPLLNFNSCQIVKEKNFHYDNYELLNGNYDLHGYFQSEKYWSHCKDEVLKYFQFEDGLMAHINLKWREVLAENPVSIHVRRSDYLNLSDYHTNLPLEYYNRAITYFEGRKFIVFSDDIEWCKKHFLGDRFRFAQGTEIEDLCLMSLCDVHIIANSSFSWWGCYLANSKKVIAPKNWFGHKIAHSTKYLYLENWIQL